MAADAVDRVDLLFRLFDVDGSGDLEAADFELMASRVVAVASESGDEAKDAIVSAFRRYWTTLVTELDADRDGRVGIEEFRACVLSPERFDDTIDEFARALAALGDPDGDGLIERPVFTALMTAIGFKRPNIDALFDAFEPNDDDQITVSVWVTGIKDYYQPDATGIAGDHLVPGAR
ncbi:calcium-binding protein [Actinosynnema sp. ALI-1.44]|uniref:EF-hand domain-containing protein n=1 Tax=Actinosynnema sp. ALI-1.44 TaxID=1933779 RepID=UPI00097BD389|nr:EF-hand domain-containing protein [Actinosynnema sp. ALI-1.44]ONI81548.1 calcium-binding protein [Actinosynnema sp. ALI-1.44]